MTASNGPEFVHNLPPPPDPGEPDPTPIVVQATLTASDDYFDVRLDAVDRALHVLNNDWGPNGWPSLRVTGVSATKLGSQVSISADGRSLVYTPAATDGDYDPLYGGLFAGKDLLFYVVEDDAGHISQANVTVTLLTPLRGPQPDHFQVLEDAEEVALDVLANDEEFAGGTIVAVEPPARGGSVTISADGKKLLFAPAAGFRGYVDFSYTVEDAAGHTASATVAVDVQSRFVAMPDDFEVDADSPEIVLNPLANDYRRQNPQPPRIVGIELPGDFVGSLAISDDGQRLLFKPAEGFVGHLSFTYTVRYGPAEHHTASSSASIAVIDPFLAVDNWFMVNPGSAGNLFDVQANDPELRHYGDPFYMRVARTITAVSTGSAGGLIEIVNDGQQIRYTPAAGFAGDETFEYTVVDETGHEDTAKVTVHVAFEEADPFNLPRFRHPAELAQFLIDEAVQRYALSFSQQYRMFVPNAGDGGGGGGGGSLATAENFAVMTRLFAGGAVLSADFSTTNVQHLGIDEADVVETDGDYIYSLTRGRLVIVDVRDLANPKLVSVTQFNDPLTEMYLQGDRLTLISRGSSLLSYGYWEDLYITPFSYGTYSNQAVVVVLDVSDRGEPQLMERTEIDGQIVDTRAIGDRVHVVTQQRVDYPRPTSRVIAEIPAEDGSGVWQVVATETLDQYIARVGDTLADLLPQFRTYDADGELIASGPLSDVGQIHKPVSSADCVLASLVTFDVADGAAGPITSTGLFTNASDNIYVSYSAVYVLRTNEARPGGSDGTRILKFEFADDGTTSLEAAGNVAGRILNQFSLDEHDGRLRIVTTETVYDSDWLRRRTQNHLFVLEHVGTQLAVVGSLENLAPTEEVKSVRFAGERAYVVTFRVVDPLFAVDLSDPAAPRIAGAIKIPGYSNYLHPVGEDFILGFGRDANQITGELGAAQVSLFYVGDLDNPRLVDRMTLSGAESAFSEAFFDHHAIAYFAEHQVLSIPISWYESIGQDTDGDGVTDWWSGENRSAAFVFQLDVDKNGGSMEFAGRIEHDTDVRRSVRIGDALVTISDLDVKIHNIFDLDDQTGEVYLGSLPRDDTFTVPEDSGATRLDVSANDRPGDGGQVPLVVEVTQPVRLCGYYGSDGPEQVGTVEIAADGKAVLFTPHENFFGTATFTYTVFDAVRGRETATVTVEVENVPDDPEAVNDEFVVAPGAVAVTLDVLANDVNVDAPPGGFGGLVRPYVATIDLTYQRIGDIVPLAAPTLVTSDSLVLDSYIADRDYLTIDWVNWPRMPSGLKIVAVGLADQGGTVAIDGSGLSLIYTPADGFEGVETFTYTIETEFGRTDVAAVAVRVGTVSDAAWADAVETLNQRYANETVELSMLNGPATADFGLPAIDAGRRSLGHQATFARGFRPLRGEPLYPGRLATDLLRLSLNAAYAARGTQTRTDDAFAQLLVEQGGGIGLGLCDELAEELAAPLAAALDEFGPVGP